MRVCSVISSHLVRSFAQAGEKGTGSLYFPSLCNDYSTKDLRQEIGSSCQLQFWESEAAGKPLEPRFLCLWPRDKKFSPAWRAKETLDSILPEHEKVPCPHTAQGTGGTFVTWSGISPQEPDWALDWKLRATQGKADESGAQEPGFWDRRLFRQGT